MLKLYLIVVKGKQQGLPIQIKHDLFLMGSEPVCQLRSQLPGIGGQHCALVNREGKVFVRDLGSGQDTTINGDLLPAGEEWAVHAGDRLQFGPLEFMIQFSEKQLSQRDTEEWALKCLDVVEEEDEEDEKEAGDEVEALKRRPTTASAAAASIFDKLNAKKGVLKGRLRIAVEGGITIMRFNDVYLVEEAEIAMIKKELFTNFKKITKRVLLDFKNVQRMSSAAALMLADAYSALYKQGSRLGICNLRPELEPMLETLDILKPIKKFTSKPVAIEASW
jgi:anti-anti-sigma regulatory factor